MGKIINFSDIKKKGYTLEDVLNRTSFDDLESIIEYYVNKSINTPDIDEDIFYILNSDLACLRYFNINDEDINKKIVSLYNKIHIDHKNNADELLCASVLTNALVDSGGELLSEDNNKILEEVNKKIKEKNLN